MRQPVGLYRKKGNGAGEEALVTGKDFPQSWSYQWHRHGFITTHSDIGTSYDIWHVSPEDARTTPLLKTPALNELRGSVSPDGRWLAYDARETARFEVFLTTFPPSGTKLPVTSEGGAEAKWSHDGKELFYVSAATGALMVATVTTGNPPTFSGHRQIHPGPLDWGRNSSHSFDIDPKTGRLVMEIVSATGDLTVLVHWQEVLKK